jgi:hypothetical protein
MKKSNLITLIAILASCTFTKQQKAEKLIKVYLDSALNDPHSYEPVSTKVDTFYNNALPDTANKVDGWFVEHTYRAKNGFGALGLHTIKVHENKDFTKILYVMTSN